VTDLQETVEWERAIGKLILSFGNLEFALMRLYELKIPSRKYFDDDFDNRFTKLIGTLKSENAKPEAIDALIELKKLSKTRHLLAHNPLYIDAYQQETTGQIKMEMSVTDKADARTRITLPHLQAEAKRTSELVAVIYNAFQPELWRDEG
jgi:hypothetical protein